MKLLELLQKEFKGSRRKLILAIVLSGGSNVGMLAVVNAASEVASYGNFAWKDFFLSLSAMGTYIFCLRFSFLKIDKIIEEFLYDTRVQLAEKIRKSQFFILEKIGKGGIYNNFTQQMGYLSQAKEVVAFSANSALIVIFSLFYISFLSLPSFFAISLLLGVGFFFLWRQDNLSQPLIKETQEKEIEFFGLVKHEIEGYKEIKVNNKRGEEVLEDLKQKAFSLENLNISINKIVNKSFLYSQCLFFLTMMVIVFFLPQWFPEFHSSAPELITAVLFLMGPLMNVVSSVPVINRANIAIEAIYALEKKLEEFDEKQEWDPEIEPFSFQKEIRFDRVEFSYTDKKGKDLFTTGPLDFHLQKGDLLMIVGGNGSGKSTLLKLLTALYEPSQGEISIDGNIIDSSNAQNYRELFSLIFTDFHLFDKLYGLPGIRQESVDHLLDKLGLAEKTQFQEGKFTNIQLSTGQRKRLALLVTLLEDRPIYIFDEWAADQDPEFRQYFYDTLLKDLKERGKTVIAVSHDDRYFHFADKLIKMDYGRIESVTL